MKSMFDPILTADKRARNRFVRSATWEDTASGDGALAIAQNHHDNTSKRRYQ